MICKCIYLIENIITNFSTNKHINNLEEGISIGSQLSIDTEILAPVLSSLSLQNVNLSDISILPDLPPPEILPKPIFSQIDNEKKLPFQEVIEIQDSDNEYDMEPRSPQNFQTASRIR